MSIPVNLPIEEIIPSNLAIPEPMRPRQIIEVFPKSGPVISFVRIIIHQLTLGLGFQCVCYLMDLNYSVIETRDISIEGDDYNNWTSDEDMTNLILSKLGLTLKV